MGVCFLSWHLHTIQLFSFNWANVCLMQNSQAAWTAETDEQRLSCLQRGPGWVLWNSLQHLHTTEHLNLPMILPLPPFAPSVQSPSVEMELAEFRWIWGSIYHQTWADDTSKCSSTMGQTCRVGQLVLSAHCPLPTSGGGYFCFWVGPLDPSVWFAAMAALWWEPEYG